MRSNKQKSHLYALLGALSISVNTAHAVINQYAECTVIKKLSIKDKSGKIQTNDYTINFGWIFTKDKITTSFGVADKGSTEDRMWGTQDISLEKDDSDKSDWSIRKTFDPSTKTDKWLILAYGFNDLADCEVTYTFKDGHKYNSPVYIKNLQDKLQKGEVTVVEKVDKKDDVVPARLAEEEVEFMKRSTSKLIDLLGGRTN
ncbi:MAG: hypothetical protein K0R14_1337 [Burkholderiales bacterium]|jgi:hypothetical protein|nr:hypothetical protein [Burkholderiales bacterium]